MIHPIKISAVTQRNQRKRRPAGLFPRIIRTLSTLLFCCPVILRTGNSISSRLPHLTYTGTYVLVDDESGNWRVKFLTSGTLVFSGTGMLTLDVFCVGGGGKGSGSWSDVATSYGGGGGLTATQYSVAVEKGASYSVVVGAGATTNNSASIRGGTSSAFSISALGGQSGAYGNAGDGGSGGSDRQYAGGTDGSNGQTVAWTLGYGQGTTTREFGESTGDLYSNGGSGPNYSGAGYPPRTNSGDGSNGATGVLYNGADGIVIVRNHRSAA